MDVLRLHRDALVVAAGVVEKVTADDLDRPTPCSQWVVADLVAHMVAGNDLVAAAVMGASLPPVTAESVRSGAVVAYRRSAERAAAAFERPGALGLVFGLPFGEVPGELFVRMRLNDQLAHAWDLARALGSSTDLAPELCVAALPLAQQRIAELGRNPALFDEEQAAGPDATAADRLAAFLGRRV